MPAPNDFINKRFEKSKMGGYKAADVDSFMAEAASMVSKQNKEMTAVKAKLAKAEERIKGFENEEESLKTTLLAAQKLADSIVRDANRKADITLKDARIKADMMIEKAENSIVARKEEAERIKKEVSDFKKMIFKLYKEHIELLNTIPAENVDSEEEKDTETVAEAEAAVTLEDGQDKPKMPSEPEIPAKEAEETKESTEDVKEEKIPEKLRDEPQKENVPKIDGGSEAQGGNDVKKTNSSAAPAIKLNLKYDEKTGEYVPVDETGK